MSFDREIVFEASFFCCGADVFKLAISNSFSTSSILHQLPHVQVSNTEMQNVTFRGQKWLKDGMFRWQQKRHLADPKVLLVSFWPKMWKAWALTRRALCIFLLFVVLMHWSLQPATHSWQVPFPTQPVATCSILHRRSAECNLEPVATRSILHCRNAECNSEAIGKQRMQLWPHALPMFKNSLQQNVPPSSEGQHVWHYSHLQRLAASERWWTYLWNSYLLYHLGYFA